MAKNVATPCATVKEAGQISMAALRAAIFTIKPDGAHDGKEDKARIDKSPGELGQQKSEKFKSNLHIEFAFAVVPGSECIGLLGNAQFVAGRGNIEQNLEPDRRQARHHGVECDLAAS